MSNTFLSILMGSDSNLLAMKASIDTLNKSDIRCKVKISSTHRTLARAHAYVKDAGLQEKLAS